LGDTTFNQTWLLYAALVIVTIVAWVIRYTTIVLALILLALNHVRWINLAFPSIASLQHSAFRGGDVGFGRMLFIRWRYSHFHRRHDQWRGLLGGVNYSF
jgi:hypothetical protein